MIFLSNYPSVVFSGWSLAVVTISVCGGWETERCVPAQWTWVSITPWTSPTWPLRKETLLLHILKIKHCESEMPNYQNCSDWLHSDMCTQRLAFLTFPTDLPAAAAVTFLRSTTAEWLSEMWGGCCLHSSSIWTAGRNGLLVQVGSEGDEDATLKL